MKSQKSRSIERISKEQEQIRQKIDHFLKQTSKTRIIYPRKSKLPQEQISVIKQAKEMQEQQKETPKLMSKMISREDIVSVKKSLSQSNFQSEQTMSKRSRLRKYQQPKIMQSFAVQTQQRTNPEKYQRRQLPSRQSNRSQVKSQKHIFQQSNYRIEEEQSYRKSSSARHKQKMFTEVVSKIGVKNSNDLNDYNQYTDLKGIHQFIRKKKNSGANSMVGKAYTEPPQMLETIQQLGRSSSFRLNNTDKQRNVTKSLISSKVKLDKLIHFNHGDYLPDIDKSRSVSKLLNKKMKTQASTPNNFISEDLKKQLKKKVDMKLSRSKSPLSKSPLSKSPSEKRLLQDYKYVLQNDDSQRIHKRSKPLLNEEKKKVKFLKIKEQMLGKIVLERVQKHLHQQTKQKANYITKVKSEKSIDEALVEFLKMKVKRADKALNQ